MVSLGVAYKGYFSRRCKCDLTECGCRRRTIILAGKFHVLSSSVVSQVLTCQTHKEKTQLLPPQRFTMATTRSSLLRNWNFTSKELPGSFSVFYSTRYSKLTALCFFRPSLMADLIRQFFLHRAAPSGLAVRTQDGAFLLAGACSLSPPLYPSLSPRALCVKSFHISNTIDCPHSISRNTH